MKMIVLAVLLPLAGCGGPENLIVGGAAVGVGVASVATIQRTPFDAVFSWWIGRDCSAVRWDRGKTYCRPMEPEPEPPTFCTRSLGSVNCWRDPENLPGHPHGVADGPAGLTREQEADRVREWPW
jgi:hypothetical protein